jgi:heme oxygenase
MANNAPFATGPREALNAALMGGTAEIHREAERRPFMVAQFKGELPKEAYAAYLGRLWYVYEALEEVSEQLRSDDRVGPIVDPVLYRKDNIEKDLIAFAGPDWRQTIGESPASKAYAGRIREVAETCPPAFVAHQWLRYLGYVLGQEILRKLVSKSYGVGEEAMNFYSFPDIADPKEYLRGYHAKMNGMPLSDAEVEQVVAEGNCGFQLQIDLTDELAAEFGIGEATQQETDELLKKLAAEHP